CAGTAFIIPRATTFICDRSHPLLNRKSDYLNHYLPKWLIDICHAERAYWNFSGATSDKTLTWHATLYDSLWISTFFFAPKVIKNLRGIVSRQYRKIFTTAFTIGGLFAVTYGIECSRRLVECFGVELPYLRTSIPLEKNFGMRFGNYSPNSTVNLLVNLFYFINRAVKDVVFMTYVPLCVAFRLPMPVVMQRVRSTLYQDFTDKEIKNLNLLKLYQPVNVDELGDEDKNCPIGFVPMVNPVRLKGCIHTFERVNINKWFLIKPTCPCCRKVYNVWDVLTAERNKSLNFHKLTGY
nr:hypothetical protein [Chlamydiota bacterium]